MQQNYVPFFWDGTLTHTKALPSICYNLIIFDKFDNLAKLKIEYLSFLSTNFIYLFLFQFLSKYTRHIPPCCV